MHALALWIHTRMSNCIFLLLVHSFRSIPQKHLHLANLAAYYTSVFPFQLLSNILQLVPKIYCLKCGITMQIIFLLPLK